jgi:hypothetical protein
VDRTDPRQVTVAWRWAVEHRHADAQTVHLLDQLTRPGRAAYWGDYGWAEERLALVDRRPCAGGRPTHRIAWEVFLPAGCEPSGAGLTDAELDRCALVTLEEDEGGCWRVCALGDAADLFGPR